MDQGEAGKARGFGIPRCQGQGGLIRQQCFFEAARSVGVDPTFKRFTSRIVV
jgi:hypothetical protein